MSTPPTYSPAVALLVLTAIGCTPEAHRYIRFPTLYGPGPAPYQRAEAIQHDPYPLNDVGPEIVGGRPREYQQPLNEVERARLAAPRPVGIGPAPAYPAPPPAITAPPVVTAPPVITTPPSVAAPPVITTPPPPTPALPTTPYQVQPRSPY